MKTTTEILINDLIKRTDENLQKAEQLMELSNEQLNWRQSAVSWSILESLEHLNLYGDFYLFEIKRVMNKGAHHKPSQTFKSGLIGNWFAEMMLPKEKLNKMKTFKDKDPLGSNLERNVLDRFIAQQVDMLDLLKKARAVNLMKIKTAISITSLLKLRLGDTFRVVIYHNDRHMAQAERVRQEYDSAKVSNLEHV